MTADTNYSFNPWMRPERLGDGLDPSPLLGPEEIILAVEMLAPVPVPAGYTPRLLGMERTEIGIVDVLNVGPATLMRVQDSGQPGTLRPSTGSW